MGTVKQISLVVFTAPLWSPLLLVGVGIIILTLFSLLFILAGALLGGIYLSWFLVERWLPHPGYWPYVASLVFLAVASWGLFNIPLVIGRHLESKRPRFHVGIPEKLSEQSPPERASG